jgi:hypothetical protein
MPRTDSRKANQRRRLLKRRQEARRRLRSPAKGAASPRTDLGPATEGGQAPGG